MGSLGWVVDTAVFNLCLHLLQLQPVRSGLIASAVAVVATYLGNRYWTYSSRTGGRRSREFALFVLFSGVGMVIQNGLLALSHYGFGYTSALADNVAKNIIGLGLATLFRFWAYRTWVFRPAPAPASTVVAGAGGSPGDRARAGVEQAGRVHR
ncbi:GtrA family protein [Streptomyces sp. NPDC021096]|uniref:GtrA family protein n=1 Tax=Streptomyces sp. NPDC021096 TaxID=3154792 RepID=UPI0033C8F4CC